MIDDLIKYPVLIQPKHVSSLGSKHSPLYTLILNLCASDQNHVCYASNIDFAEYLKVSIRTVSNTLNYLAEIEWIATRGKNQKRIILAKDKDVNIVEKVIIFKKNNEPEWFDQALAELCKMD